MESGSVIVIKIQKGMLLLERCLSLRLRTALKNNHIIQQLWQLPHLLWHINVFFNCSIVNWGSKSVLVDSMWEHNNAITILIFSIRILFESIICLDIKNILILKFWIKSCLNFPSDCNFCCRMKDQWCPTVTETPVYFMDFIGFGRVKSRWLLLI